MTRTRESQVFVDGNNVMGSRPDGWWRDRAGAAQRLSAEIALLADDGVWTIVFDGDGSHAMGPAKKHLTIVHAARGRDGADDCIVELVSALPDPTGALVYTSDARLRARLRALDARVAGARTLLKEIEAVRGAKKAD